MMAVPAYYDGESIKPLEPFTAKPNQKIVITVLDDFLESSMTKKPRIGAARGKFKAPDDIDFCNDEIAKIFYGEDQ